MVTMEHVESVDACAAEKALLRAVLKQAVRDLGPGAQGNHRLAARHFFQALDGNLNWLCDMLDLDWRTVQRRVQALYPGP
jgi:hypothetical protein